MKVLGPNVTGTTPQSHPPTDECECKKEQHSAAQKLFVEAVCMLQGHGPPTEAFRQKHPASLLYETTTATLYRISHWLQLLSDAVRRLNEHCEALFAWLRQHQQAAHAVTHSGCGAPTRSLPRNHALFGGGKNNSCNNVVVVCAAGRVRECAVSVCGACVQGFLARASLVYPAHSRACACLLAGRITGISRRTPLRDSPLEPAVDETRVPSSTSSLPQLLLLHLYFALPLPLLRLPQQDGAARLAASITPAHHMHPPSAHLPSVRKPRGIICLCPVASDSRCCCVACAIA